MHHFFSLYMAQSPYESLKPGVSLHSCSPLPMPLTVCPMPQGTQRVLELLSSSYCPGAHAMHRVAPLPPVLVVWPAVHVVHRVVDVLSPS